MPKPNLSLADQAAPAADKARLRLWLINHGCPTAVANAAMGGPQDSRRVIAERIIVWQRTLPIRSE